jgi:hypothetical protein
VSVPILEQPSGRGLLVGDGVEAQVSYALRVTQETIGGWQDVGGQVEFDDPRQEAVLLGTKLILHLEDGRRLAVIIAGQGQIRGTGGFFKP